MYGCFLLHLIATPNPSPGGGERLRDLWGRGFTGMEGRASTRERSFCTVDGGFMPCNPATHTQCLVSAARVIPLSTYLPALFVELPLFAFVPLAGLRPRVVLRHGQGDHVPWRQRRRGAQAVGPRLRLYDQLYVCEQRSGEQETPPRKLSFLTSLPSTSLLTAPPPKHVTPSPSPFRRQPRDGH